MYEIKGTTKKFESTAIHMRNYIIMYSIQLQYTSSIMSLLSVWLACYSTLKEGAKLVY